MVSFSGVRHFYFLDLEKYICEESRIKDRHLRMFFGIRFKIIIVDYVQINVSGQLS